MNTVTINDVKNNLELLVEQVISDLEPTIISTGAEDQVVMMPLNEFNAWQETLYLLSNPANAEHLRKSIIEAETGKTIKANILTELTKLVEHLQQKKKQASLQYSQTSPSQRLQERLVQDYDELSTMYSELADELTDEIWLPLENKMGTVSSESLQKIDQALSLHLDLCSPSGN